MSDADMVEFGAATQDDLSAVVGLLVDDELGRDRETDRLEPYQRAFDQISADPNHQLVVGRFGGQVVCCLQLSILPCLTHGGTTRAQIEGVRVAGAYRGRGFGHVMIWWTVEEAKRRGCGIVQLTTDRRRTEAAAFYERQGFVTTHHGMKLWIDPLETA